MIAIQKDEVNTGRQTELDLVKGFLMVMIIFIHSYQTINTPEASASSLYKILFAFFMPTGACLYLFAMGFGSVFSRRNEPKDLAKSGVKLLFYQALSNACYGLCLLIPFAIHNLFASPSQASVDAYHATLYSMLTFINIFFISGMCYLVLAIYKAIKMPLIGYGISALLVGIISPFTGTLVSENAALNWILDVTFGGKGEATFCFFPYISFVFLGYIFAKLIRRIKTEDKKDFYKLAGCFSLGITISWIGIIIATHPSLNSFYDYMHAQYHIPGIAKVIGSCAVIVLFFTIAYFIAPGLEKCKFVYHKLNQYSKQISKVYAVHIGVYMVISAATAFCGFGTYACLIWSVVVLVVTDLLVSAYVLLEQKVITKK